MEDLINLNGSQTPWKENEAESPMIGSEGYQELLQENIYLKKMLNGFLEKVYKFRNIDFMQTKM